MRFARFIVVGVVNTALYLALSAWLEQGIGLGVEASGCLAYASCIPVAYTLHRLLVFGARPATVASASRFAAVQLSCLLAVWLYTSLASRLGYHGWPVHLSVSALLPPLSFAAMRTLVFMTEASDDR